MILDRAETMSTDERAALQAERLRGMVDRLLAADGLQARRLRESGVDSGAAVALADLPKLPTTAKGDLWEHYPFGLVAVPMDEVTVVHGSSGTGGRPTLVAYTAGDIALWSTVMARSLAGAGATRSSIVHNAYGYGLFTGGLGVHQGAQALGATVVPMSGGMTARQIRILLDLRPDVLDLHSLVRRLPGRGVGRRREWPRRRYRSGSASTAPNRGPTRSATRSNGCCRSVRSTSTACPRSSGRAWPARRWTPTAGCTSRRTTSWSRRWTRPPARRPRPAPPAN